MDKILENDGWQYSEMIIEQNHYAGHVLTWLITAEGHPWFKWGIHQPPIGVLAKEINHYAFKVKMEKIEPFVLDILEDIGGDCSAVPQEITKEDRAMLKLACQTAAYVSRQGGHTDQCNKFHAMLAKL
jgi:hypothetical protein